MKNLFIDLLAFGTLFSSVLVITSKNPVIAVTFLIAAFINAAGYLILIGVGFIGISYIIIYIGAITVLFLFVIMLLNIKLSDILETSSQYTKNIPLALALGIVFIYEIYTIAPFPLYTGSLLSYFLNLFFVLNGLLLNNNLNLDNVVHISLNPNIADTVFIKFSQIEAIGQGLYTYGAIWLILSSVILLLAMVAAIFISLVRRRSHNEKANNLTPLTGLNNKEVNSKLNGKRFYHSSPKVK